MILSGQNQSVCYRDGSQESLVDSLMLPWGLRTFLTTRKQKSNGLSNGRDWGTSVALGSLQVFLLHLEVLRLSMRMRGGQMLQSNEPALKVEKRLVLVDHILSERI